jgi:hypothetical protein
MPDFCSGATGLSGRFSEGFSLRRSHPARSSVPCPNCYLCGTGGEPLYEGLKDRLFNAPGEWNLKRCPNPECGLLWLDPMPLEEDIGMAYETYFTHAAPEDMPPPAPPGARPRAAEILGQNFFVVLTEKCLRLLQGSNPARVGCRFGMPSVFWSASLGVHSIEQEVAATNAAA